MIYNYYSNTYGHSQVEKKVGESKTEKGGIIKKVYELEKDYGFDVALILRQNG